MSRIQRAQMLLLREIPEYGYVNALQVASIADDINFMSTNSCQSLLAKIWYGQVFRDSFAINVRIN